jgi:hypothetical protein
VSTTADIVVVFAPGPYRDAHNAERFYAAFESWLSERTTTVRGPDGRQRVVTPFTWYEEGPTTGDVGTHGVSSPAKKAAVALATSRSTGRRSAPTAKPRTKQKCHTDFTDQRADHDFEK